MKDSESGLVESQLFALRSLVENSPDNIMLLDRERRIQFINWTVPGRTRDSVLGMTLDDFAPSAFQEHVRTCFARVLATGRPDRYESSYIGEDGEVSIWESRVSAVTRSGEVVGFAMISSNVSERRKAAADRDRFFNLSLDMLCIAQDGYFRRLNPAFQRVLGYEDEELMARPFLEFVHPDDQVSTSEAWQRLESGADIAHFENRYRHKDGSYRWLSWHSAWDPARRVVHAVARDVTQQRELQARLRQSQKMDAVGKLAAGIAHDFNNLILVITGNADLAERARAPDDRTRFLSEVHRAALRAQELTRQLLAVGRHANIPKARVDLRAMTLDLSRMLWPLLPPSVRFDLDLPEVLPDTEGDRGQLEQVLLNLCLNARDAMPNGGRLGLRVATIGPRELRHARGDRSDDRSWLRVVVEDEGTGMDAQVREHLFEPFFTTKQPGKGTGLGLSTAYGIVQAHGGFIRVDSEPGRGSRFEVFLPIASGQRPADSQRADDADLSGRGETILVAEDVASVRQMVAKMLDDAGYRCVTAADGEQALTLYRVHRTEIDLLLLDLVMPKVSGIDVLQEIRTLDTSVPVVFTSGYADAASYAAIRLTSAPLLSKPYARTALLREVRGALDNAAKGRRSVG